MPAAGRRGQAQEPVDQRLRSNRHVVGGDKHHEERGHDPGDVEADGRDRPDEALGLVRPVLDELLDAFPDLAGILTRHLGVLALEVVDDSRHVVHELVRLVDERGE